MIAAAPLMEDRATVKDFRIVGRYLNGQAFLIVLGVSREECSSLLTDLLAEWTYAELLEVSEVWHEEWRGVWVPDDEAISLRRIRQRAAAKNYHANKRNTAGPSS